MMERCGNENLLAKKKYCTLLCFIESGQFNVKDMASRSQSSMSQSSFGYF